MGDAEDAVPAEWTRMQEERAAREEAEKRAMLAERRHRNEVLSIAIPIALVAVALGTVGIAALAMQSPPPPATTPAAVRAFAAALPSTQRPNAAGVSVIDGSNAPESWRVAWETTDAAFCFAFVHDGRAPQVLCDAPGSVRTSKMRIAGELTDDGIDPAELFTCGYTTGQAANINYVELDDGTVVGTAADMGSGLSGFCIQMPEGTAAGASFTVSTFIVNGRNGRFWDITPVTATYP
ncbi:MAG TPA: hypothetical protein VFN97_11220 [Actinospica sp.]|nr:hypothetical protein [Actinospica sp.]